MNRTKARFHPHSLWCAAASLAFAALLGPHAQAASIYDFDIYAKGNVMIGVGTIIATKATPALVGAGTMVVGVGDASLNGTAGIYGDLRAGDDVSLGNNSFVSGTITNPDQFTVGSGVTYGAHIVAMPDLPTLPAATVYSAGVTNQSVGNGGTITLAPGSYNDITLGGAATLNLAAGDYYLNSISAGNGLTLNVTVPVGQTRIFVVQDVSFGGTVAMNVTGSDPHSVFVETHSTSLNAFRIGGGSGTNWTGDVFTPNGGIHFGSGSSQGTVSGYLWAGTTVDFEHGLDYLPPVHVPEPGSWILLASGMIGAVGCARRRSRRAPIA